MDEGAQKLRHYSLIKQAQAGGTDGEQATEQMLVENMGLVRAAALRFRDRGVDEEDLLQIGAMGMLRAIRCFDLSRGLAFSTFAVPLIVGEIRRYLRDEGPMRVSRSYKRLAAELAAAGREIAAREGREPSVTEIAAACGVSREEAAVALASVAPVTSLQEAPFEEERGELADRITDEESATEPQRLCDHMALGEAISRLPPLWRRILLLRYYRDCTQQQTAEALGLTQVKVSREEKKILGFLRGELIV